MVDEVFAHRLGMVPLNVDPALLEIKENPSDQATDRNTIVFKLKVDCTRNLLAPRDCTDSAVLYNNSEVLAQDLRWEPQGEQLEIFAKRPPAPTIPETVLVKMRPGQGVEMEMHAVKGLGKDHAKFSPVGTFAYGLLHSPLLKRQNPVWCSDGELSVITTHRFGRSKSCTTTPRNPFPELLRAWGHQCRCRHKTSHC